MRVSTVNIYDQYSERMAVNLGVTMDLAIIEPKELDDIAAKYPKFKLRRDGELDKRFKENNHRQQHLLKKYRKEYSDEYSKIHRYLVEKRMKSINKMKGIANE